MPCDHCCHSLRRWWGRGVPVGVLAAASAERARCSEECWHFSRFILLKAFNLSNRHAALRPNRTQAGRKTRSKMLNEVVRANLRRWAPAPSSVLGVTFKPGVQKCRAVMLHSGHDFAQGNVRPRYDRKGGRGNTVKALKSTKSHFPWHRFTWQLSSITFGYSILLHSEVMDSFYSFLNMTWSVLFSLNTARMLSGRGPGRGMHLVWFNLLSPAHSEPPIPSPCCFWRMFLKTRQLS